LNQEKLVMNIVKTRNQILFLLITAHISLFTSPVQSQAPLMINYQGRLVDGTNLVNGTVQLELSLYNSDVGGSLLYTDFNPAVTVLDGLYHTYIGDDTTFGMLRNALTNSLVWLQVVVDGTPLTPRERLVAVPYALRVYGYYLDDQFSVVMSAEEGGNTVGGSGAGGSVVSGGTDNRAQAFRSTIGGGWSNRAEGAYSMIGGGQRNRTVGGDATVGGGAANVAGGLRSTIAGGGGNETVGDYGTIPGGHLNVATNYAFAAGRRAKATNTGSFVWADSTDANFASTGINQFLIRAGGGVGINTNNPKATLHVAGSAMIGNNPQPATFGMQKIRRNSSGPIVPHPGINLNLYWDATGRILSITNNTGGFIQVAISQMADNPINSFGRSFDLPNLAGTSVTNTVFGLAMGWRIIVGSDVIPQGVSIDLTTINTTISGVATYWE